MPSFFGVWVGEQALRPDQVVFPGQDVFCFYLIGFVPNDRCSWCRYWIPILIIVVVFLIIKDLKNKTSIIHDFIFADDAAFDATSTVEEQDHVNHFSQARKSLNGTKLLNCYTSLDDEIVNWIVKADIAFGKIHYLLCNKRGINLQTTLQSTRTSYSWLPCMDRSAGRPIDHTLTSLIPFTRIN